MPAKVSFSLDDLIYLSMENVNKPSTSIKNWAIDDRPREKLR